MRFWDKPRLTNYDKGSAAESKPDFAHKLNVAFKELVKTGGWLRFVIIAELLPAKRIEAVLDECEQLCRILGKSVATAKGKRRKNDESGGEAGRTERFLIFNFQSCLHSNSAPAAARPMN